MPHELAELFGRSVRPSPLLIMLAGSNGAGKSTFYDAYLDSLALPFLNADRIAEALFWAEPNPERGLTLWLRFPAMAQESRPIAR